MSKVIGIDPDSTAHGMAIYQHGQLVELGQKTLIELIVIAQARDVTKWVIEDVTKNNFVYNRNVLQSPAATQKVARNVGMCQQSMVELVRALEYLGQDFMLVPPTKQNWAKNKKEFERMTGWSSRSNVDTRSAAYFGFLGA